MKLFIHKVDIFLDVFDDNTLSQEIVCFVKAITDVNVSCPFDRIYIIGKHSKVLQTHANGEPFIVAIDVKQMLQNCFKVDCNDVWLLWGGWVELINDFNLVDAKTLVDLHNMWSKALCIKFALCTDMRFPFKKTVFLNAGRIDFVRQGFPPVLELTQCINKTDTIFADVKFLPLFMMPTYTTVKLQHRIVSNKTSDLVYATRDWHMLSESRRKKIAQYYVQDGVQSTFMGQHKHVNRFEEVMTAEQKQILDKTCKFVPGTSFYGVPLAMSYSIANVAIGDAEYEKYGLMPNRVGEAVAAGIISFIDNDIDKDHVLFGSDASLANISYVKTAQDVKYRLSIFKQQPELYDKYCALQAQHLRHNFDLSKHFYATTWSFIAAHKNMQHCEACPNFL